MKITGVEARVAQVPKPDREPWVSLKPSLRVYRLLVKVFTDAGFVGCGTSSHQSTARPAAKLIQDGFKDLVVGEDPLRPEMVWDRMFRTTYQRLAAERGWGRGPLVTACSVIDMALWDILGKAAGIPLYKLLGGYTNRVRVYAGGGYYRQGKDLAELRDEMLRFRALGYDAFKMKIGGLSLREDVARVAAVRDAIGPESPLMVDVNGAWDLDAAREGVRALRDFNLTWIEEPLWWADAKGSLPRLRADCPIPIAEGHGEESHFACMEFIERGAVDIIQFDATSFGGITQSRKIMGMAEAHHLRFSPHLELQVHAHLVAASPAGFMVESHADPQRDPLWFDLFGAGLDVKDGWIELPDRPGLGIEFDERMIARYAGQPA